MASIVLIRENDHAVDEYAINCCEDAICMLVSHECDAGCVVMGDDHHVRDACRLFLAVGMRSGVLFTRIMIRSVMMTMMTG